MSIPVSARFRRLLAAALLVTLPLLAAACGDDDQDEGTAGTDDTPAGDAGDSSDSGGDYSGGYKYPDDAGASSADVTITSLSYDDITVDAGQKVVIQNNGSVDHTFTADEGEFDSGEIEPESKGEVTAPSEAGDYGFHCEIHPEDMQATMTVG
jgi:plastocyanin